MPWEIKKKGDQHCVVKKGTDKVVKCHGSRSKAVAHMRALYSNVHAALTAQTLSEIFAEAAVTEQTEDTVLVTIENVPIASTGIEYPLASGATTFTQGDLEDAVRAYGDPHVLAPRLKIGHTNASHWVEAGGEPAFGKVENLRLGDNDQTIYGDYVGVPGWLADILPTVYPNRSFEGSRDLTTVGGNRYKMVINAVALLGVRMPGITSLKDLKGKFGAEMPEGVEIAAESEITAAIDIEDIRRQYYDSLETDQGMWWIRSMQLNPNELIVDGADGKLYRVPFKVKGDKTSFEDPVEVKIQYEDVAAEAAIPLFIAGIEAAAEHNRREVTVFASRQEAGRDVIATKEGGTDLDLKDVAKRLGLPEDATEEQVNERLDALRGSGPGDNPGSGQAGSGEPPMEPSASDATSTVGPSPEVHHQQPAGNTGGPATVPPIPPDENIEPPEPVIAEDGTVKLDKATYELLIQGARAATSIKAENDKLHRESIVAQAVRDGKIMPASREHYIRLFASDPTGTQKLLTASVAEGGLAPGLVPVAENGHGGGNEGNGADGEGLPEEWFPSIGRRRQQALLAEHGQTRIHREALDAREKS